MQNLGNNLLFFKFFMGTEVGDTNNSINRYKDINPIIITSTGLHVFGYPEHHEVRSERYDVTDLKRGCLRSYQSTGIHSKDEFVHVTELLSRVLELEKNIDEVQNILTIIASQSGYYKQSFDYLSDSLNTFYLQLTQQPNQPITQNVEEIKIRFAHLLKV